MKKFLIFAGMLLLILSVACLWTRPDGEQAENVPQPAETEQTEALAPSATPTAELPAWEEEIKGLMQNSFSGVDGTCHWAVYTFADGKAYRNTSAAVPSASVIKIFIMDYVFDRMNAGELEYTDTIEGKSVENLLENMITVSDNTATNVLIDHFGMDALNRYFAAEGYADTKVNRRMLDYDAMAAGIENLTSVEDVIRFLRKLYENPSDWTCTDMLAIMQRQKVKTKIPQKLSGVTVAHKTGELDTVENDVGIIFAEEGDFAVAFLCSELSSTDAARRAIGTAAAELHALLTEK